MDCDEALGGLLEKAPLPQGTPENFLTFLYGNIWRTYQTLFAERKNCADRDGSAFLWIATRLSGGFWKKPPAAWHPRKLFDLFVWERLAHVSDAFFREGAFTTHEKEGA